ncbi:MAG: polyprenyl synthetase family protein [Candidatus Poseidoniales archaeon]|jgi:octaprenyl-diphosphate synthase|nr:polyprenyl synthetase family protein [Candidatus Poseidoniales archaeon]|tara:strand:- start:3643 stop:4623 length:981 start_codon:yes stop_codon:yes gene_type:complete
MVSLRSARQQLSRRRDVIEEALEDFVQEKMASSQAPAMILAREVLLAGGKRYRPILALLAYESAGGEDISKVMDLALSAEIIHTATLVHDDIYDFSKTRRGKPTLHASHGLAYGIIGGDYLFVLGFGLGGKYEAQIVEKMAETCANIATGELLQLDHIGNLATTPEDYYSIIDGKTAGPFAAACSCAAIVAGAPEDVVQSLEKFGWEVGRAFQLVDDLLDLTGDENMGKPRGGDVHEGKMTLPIIHALTMLHGVEREQLSDILKNFSDDRWSELVSLLSSAGSFEYSEQLIENHVNRALVQLESLPQSIARDLMSEVAKRSRSRKK